MEKEDFLICSQCRNGFDISKFISLKNGSQTLTCLNCRKSVNKRRLTEPLQKTYDKIKELMVKCCICGDDDKNHLELDHIDPSQKIEAVRKITTPEAMMDEYKKCRVICGKCHRKSTVEKKHFLSKNHAKNKQTSLSKIRNREYNDQCKLKVGKCQNPDCSDKTGFDPNLLSFYEWDHVDPMTKTYNIGRMINDECSIELIDGELEFCQLLCRYCHALKTREDEKIMSKYYSTLTRPLSGTKIPVSKKKKPTPKIREIRELYHSSDITIRNLAVKYEYSYSYMVYIIDNEVYCDETYIRTRFDQKKYPQLTNDQIKEIENIILNNPETSIGDLTKKFNCTRGTITGIISSSDTEISDPNFKEKYRNERNEKIRNDYINGDKTSVLMKKYNLSQASISNITRGVVQKNSAKNIKIERDKLIRADYAKGMINKDLAVKYKLSRSTISTIVKK